MKIFLSYASEQKAISEPIAFSLRSRGHSVFLDRDDLPAGKSYDDQIHKAISGSDLLIYLVSPESVAPGRYTLSELDYARRIWRHPANRVMPVLVAPTDLGAIPAFLKGVTILEPQGNLTAEVGAAVEGLRSSFGRLWRTTWRAAGIAGLTYFAVLAIGAAWTAYFHPDQSPLNPAELLVVSSAIFAGPLCAVLWTVAPKRSWAAILPAVTIVPVIIVLYSLNITVVSEIDPNTIGLQNSAAGAPSGEGGAVAPAPDLSDAQRALLDQITAANRLSKIINGFLLAVTAGALLMTFSLVGAAIAAPELRSFWRWFVSVAFGGLLMGLLLTPIIDALAPGSMPTMAQTLWGVTAFGIWLAATGGLVGYWLAHGDPDETAAVK